MGEDGIADDDLQVVSGERELENLDPKERAKLEKKRGLIRAGMGAAADDAEDAGFEVAKASSAAMAMLGVRKKRPFAVEGLEVADDREYGSDKVGKPFVMFVLTDFDVFKLGVCLHGSTSACTFQQELS